MSGLVDGVNEDIQVKNGQEKYDVKLGIREWKRYPEYKDSGVEWIGEIPKEWEAKPLKRIVENVIIKGVGKKLPFIALEHIVSGTGQLIEGFEWQTVKADDYAVFTKGDILFGKLRPYLRKYYIADEDGCCPTELLVLRSSEEEKIHNKYLFYILQSLSFIYLTDSTSYGVKMPRTSWDKISQKYFMISTLLEQQTITNFLDVETSKIDTLIEKKQRLIELLEEKRSALISHAVTKGLDPHVKMKDSGVEWIGELPENWDIKPFRRICTVNQGLQIAQSERFYESTDTRLEYITIKSIHDKNAAREYIENPPKSVVCHQNDILLARTGATGEVITNQEGVFHNNFFLIKYDSKKVYRDFLVYYLKNKLIKSFILLLAGTTTIPDLNHGDFLSVPFVSPSFKEQQSITNFLDRKTEKIDTFINKISAQIEKLKEYRTALISAAVTGKIDVREEVA